jgi:ubiquinone biosynthesis protein UbiJ
MPATPAWIAVVETSLNRGIEGGAEAADLARRLDATALGIEIEGMLRVRVTVSGARVGIVTGSAADEAALARPANATIAGSALSLLRLATGGSGVSAQRSVQVRGDAETANLYRQLFARARPDWEEELSRAVGDAAARRLSRAAGTALAWARRTRRTALENVAEYLQEESRDLVNTAELQEFLHGVDVLRETADRVEARIVRLERRLKAP